MGLARIGWSLSWKIRGGNGNGVFIIIVRDCAMMIFLPKKNSRIIFFSWLWSFGALERWETL